MSESDEDGVLTRTYRTVTPSSSFHPDAEMDVIGWSIFLGLLLLLLPLLPFLIVLWALTKLLDVLTQKAPGEEAE